MAVLAIQDASAGLDSVAFSTGAAGDQIESGGRAGGWELGVTVLLCKNLSGVATRDVTVNGNTITMPASGEGALPVRGASAFGDLLDITYEVAADTSVAAVRV